MAQPRGFPGCAAWHWMAASQLATGRIAPIVPNFLGHPSREPDGMTWVGNHLIRSQNGVDDVVRAHASRPEGGLSWINDVRRFAAILR